MSKHFNIFSLVIYFSSILIIVRVERILLSIKNVFGMYFYTNSSNFPNDSITFINFIFLVVLILITIKFRKTKLFQIRIKFSYFMAFTILMSTVFTSLISNFDSEKNTHRKLLSPMKIIKVSFNSDELTSASESLELNSQSVSVLIPFGTDEFGRDIFSRIIYGIRKSVLIALSSVSITILLGIGFSFIGSITNRFIDFLFNRMSDFFLAFPIIFFAILLLALFGQDILVVIIVLGFAGWMSLYKILRTEIVTIQRKDFYKTATLIGKSKFNLLRTEILPYIIIPVIINSVLYIGTVILAESALSYLGLGNSGEIPSLGIMIRDGQEFLTKAWWLSIIPCLFVFIIVYTFNKLGEDLQLLINPMIEND